jgi:hypothetical protein
LAFTLAYFFWGMVHMQREFWAMTKKSISEKKIKDDQGETL